MKANPFRLPWSVKTFVDGDTVIVEGIHDYDGHTVIDAQDGYKEPTLAQAELIVRCVNREEED